MREIFYKYHHTIAFTSDTGFLTFGQLKTQVENIASEIKKDIANHSKVLATVAKDPEVVIKLFLASMLLGREFAPLNPKTPPKLLAEQITLLNAQLLSIHGEHKTQAPQKSLWDWDFKFDQRALILMTSGSTGKPKGVLLSWGNLYHSALGSNLFYKACPGDTWQHFLPMFHIAGFMIPIRSLIAGGVTHFGSFKRADFTSLVPTQLLRILDKPKLKKELQKMKAVLIGGAVLPQAILEEAILAKINISITYGCTESTAGLCATQVGKNYDTQCCGDLLPFRQVKSSSGLIAFRGLTRFIGYITPKGLQKPFDSKGFFETKDLGELKNGRVFIYGREDDIVIVGGENINPLSIEKILQPTCPQGLLHVVGIPDKEWGQRLAVIVWSRKKPDLSLLHKTIKDEFSGPFQPKYVHWNLLAKDNHQKISRSLSRRVGSGASTRQGR